MRETNRKSFQSGKCWKPEQLGLSSSIRLEQKLRYKSWLNRLSDSPARLPCVLTKKLKEKSFSRIIPKRQKLQWWNFTIKSNTTLGKFCEILSPIGETVHPKDPRVQNPLWGSGNPEVLKFPPRGQAQLRSNDFPLVYFRAKKRIRRDGGGRMGWEGKKERK